MESRIIVYLLSTHRFVARETTVVGYDAAKLSVRLGGSYRVYVDGDIVACTVR